MLIQGIDDVKPSTIFAWMGGAFLLLQFVLLIRRTNNDPLLREIKRVEDRINSVNNEVKETLELHDDKIENRINGWSQRIEENRRDIDRHEAAIATHAIEQIRSQEDRKRLNEKQVEINAKLENLVNLITGVERSLRDKLDTQTKEIMNAIHKRLDGRNNA